MQIWADLEGHLIPKWKINFIFLIIFEKKNMDHEKKIKIKKACQKSAKVELF
jgi:hypothetical protein